MGLRIWISGFGSDDLNTSIWVSAFRSLGFSLRIWMSVFGSLGLGIRISIYGTRSHDLDLLVWV